MGRGRGGDFRTHQALAATLFYLRIRDTGASAARLASRLSPNFAGSRCTPRECDSLLLLNSRVRAAGLPDAENCKYKTMNGSTKIMKFDSTF
ncbi:hypothetical protein ebA339 [Aromatoleum aromaticum EbN1]|uniref:Uncharacterized protein n=1 Tax=Aromatoleum aromaticum (strain DSM 19018 / LMG 30748 / EbN1) TaxID=76114 RepID=Q5P8R1_AROAE|nr:hypothetical protein ebA339 [Aromatoleum aromaticum EbN1]